MREHPAALMGHPRVEEHKGRRQYRLRLVGAGRQSLMRRQFPGEQAAELDNAGPKTALTSACHPTRYRRAAATICIQWHRARPVLSAMTDCPCEAIDLINVQAAAEPLPFRVSLLGEGEITFEELEEMAAERRSGFSLLLGPFLSVGALRTGPYAE